MTPRRLLTAILLVVLALAGCGSTGKNAVPRATPEATMLQQVADECGSETDHIFAADKGHTLIIDREGEDDLGGATVGETVCVLFLLETPVAVTSRMDATRALDGRQEATWPGYAMSWTYHPSTGLDVIITTE